MGVFDIDAKTFGDWIPLSGLPAEEGIESKQLKIIGNRIFYIAADAKVRMIDLKDSSSVMLNAGSESPSRDFEGSKMVISTVPFIRVETHIQRKNLGDDIGPDGQIVPGWE